MTRNRIPTMKEYWARRMDLGTMPQWDGRGHEHSHNYKTIVYTSKSTIDTDPGAPMKPSFGGHIVRVGAKVTDAPSGGDLKIDLQVDGYSIFDTSFLLIKDGTTASQFKIVERPDFNEDSVFRVEVDTVSGAGGPFTLTIDYEPGDL